MSLISENKIIVTVFNLGQSCPSYVKYKTGRDKKKKRLQAAKIVANLGRLGRTKQGDVYNMEVTRAVPK